MGFTNVHGVPGRVGNAARGALIDGRTAAQALRAETAELVAGMLAAGTRAPALATILVGEDPASSVYVSAKHRACEQVGIRSIDQRLGKDIEAQRLAQSIQALNDDETVDGILLQLPLPKGLDAATLVGLIDVRKDVDGLTTANTGLLWQQNPALAPCTPLGVIELLDRAGVELAGREAVVVGRSSLVGRPLAAMLLARDATVTVCHRHTRRLASVCRRADVLIVACGIPHLIGVDHVKPGAVVIDVGINRTERGILGDVDFDSVRPISAAITPVPGGVGPMTIACLLANTLRAAELRAPSGAAPTIVS
ncbi:MAG TPA: bifunctional methylenetetrahydrofolate dehydrogenase/methenyltetrahydrofolate cyclohydrolase FolD [Solirubrobacteraceae bacterium]|jgi:methylenetetrahydrofolate dehydrogenase (NADP+)/methenyltetrahydrofolate cyclohydrolase|nr:bifunctional methylenetetrahydrofolate dehydrogenase/methenyltetrahydrofolate cyclohydrolase FolD [Solirubrobacteraceae bacterium]